MATEINSIGLVELSSVATGMVAEDVMLKAGSVKLLLARSICSGKFLIVVAGDVTSVQAALAAGQTAAGASLIERRQIARVHPTVLQAISADGGHRAEPVEVHRRRRDVFRGQHYRSSRRGSEVGQRYAAAHSPGHGAGRQGLRGHGRRCVQRAGGGRCRLARPRPRTECWWARA